MKIDFYVLHMFVHKQNTIKIIKHLIDNPWVALNLLVRKDIFQIGAELFSTVSI